MDLASTAWGAGEGEEWELRHDDDGFTYKILKRQRLLDPAAGAVQPSLTDPKAEERHRRQRKKNALLKLKSQYQKELDQWELLSSTLQAMEEKANQQLELQKRQQDVGKTASSSLESSLTPMEGSENACGSLIDELLSQAEAQEAVIRDVSYLCDIAEAMCSAQEEWLAQSFIDLPVWSSPRKLIASLCDE
ncbi:hypothetical protein JCGZ_10238 [Jatropha curcas]|uniref:Uncharacterized protein n=1 Tax=Jatropha curcas TaxID=180498 RepID=A0A067LGC5_JATCU|nr:uncharacterized protein LOC105633789 [Jatropha curcas]KDP46398.1 hypothetical protein JCGZ_10238 [Jatropha curcas]